MNRNEDSLHKRCHQNPTLKGLGGLAFPSPQRCFVGRYAEIFQPGSCPNYRSSVLRGLRASAGLLWRTKRTHVLCWEAPAGGGGNPLGFVGAVVTHSSVTKVCTKTIPSAYRKNISCNNESLKTIKSER